MPHSICEIQTYLYNANIFLNVPMTIGGKKEAFLKSVIDFFGNTEWTQAWTSKFADFSFPV